MKQKIGSTLDAAVADIPDGARIMFGGFGGAGFPNNLIQALSRKGIKNVVAISNNCGTRDGELGIMFKNGQVKHVICSFPGPHANYFQEQFARGEVTCELVPNAEVGATALRAHFAAHLPEAVRPHRIRIGAVPFNHRFKKE